jgi:hypothetical protein
LRNSGASFARHLVTARNVDDIQSKVHEFSAELRREIVAAAFHQEEIRVVRDHQLVERVEVVADVFSNRSVRASPRLDGSDAVRRKRLVALKKLGIFSREDIVGHDAEPQTGP